MVYMKFNNNKKVVMSFLLDECNVFRLVCLTCCVKLKGKVAKSMIQLFATVL